MTESAPSDVRFLLRQFISQVGIVEAGIHLRRHVIALERMAAGIDPITKDVLLGLAGLSTEPGAE